MRRAPPIPFMPYTNWPRAWRRIKRPLVRWSLVALTLLLIFAAWPFATLWRLDQALVDGDRQALSRLIDLEAVREQIGQRLNQDQESDIGPLSDTFIAWIESGLHQNGPDLFLDERVTLDWIRNQLNARSPTDHGILSVLSYAFFWGPRDFDVHIGAKDADPVIMRMHLQGLGWRVVMLYY